MRPPRIAGAARTARAHRYRGYSIARGSYRGTHQDRIDRWYIDAPAAALRDRSGPGYPTLADATAAIDDHLAARETA
jgi:hypothetical protein